MRACKCPNCGVNLTFDETPNNYVFCQYCGAKIDLLDQRTMHTERIYDDARVKNADSIHRIVDIFASPFEDHRRKKAEKEAREAREAEEAREAAKAAQAQSQENMEAFEAAFVAGLGRCIQFVKTHRSETLSAIAGLAVLFALFSGSSHISEVKKQKQAESIVASHAAMGEILYPSGASSSGDYRNTYKKLKDAGFTNVTAEGAGDLFFGILETENDIIEVTVDGAPEFDDNTWYPADTPIVIKYHSFSKETESTIKSGTQTVTQKAQDAVNSAVSSAQNKTSEIAASVSSVISDTIDEVSSGDTTYSRSVSPSALSYDLCFVHRYSDYDAYYAIRKDDSTVRYFTTNDLSVMVSKRKTGSLRSAGGMVVSFPYNGGFEVSLRYTYPDKDNTITVTAADGTTTDFSLIGSAAVKRVLSSDDYFDWNPSQPKPESSITNRAATSSSSDASASSKESLSPELRDELAQALLDYYSRPSMYSYDLCYVRHGKDYDMYYGIWFGDGSVRSFSTNGDLSVQVGKITSGDLETGMVVHYPYGGGWNETMKYTKVGSDQAISVTLSGYTVTFTKITPDAMRKVLSTDDYYDWVE